MQLSEFIKEVLVEIVTGIKEANKELESSDASINPSRLTPENFSSNSGLIGTVPDNYDPENRLVHIVKFDVAVNASQEKESKGGLGIVVASFALGAQGKTENVVGTTSRIQFDVPIIYPQGK